MAQLEFLQPFRDAEREKQPEDSVWYAAAAAALTSAGAGPAVRDLYNLATTDLPLDQRKIVQRRIKESVLKSTVFCGVPRTAQALFPLFKDLKDEEIDDYAPRTEWMDPSKDEERIARGEKYFDILWTPEGSKQIRDTLIKYHPDLYLLNQKFIYEFWLAENRILTDIETQICNIAALVPTNSPEQLTWHIRGLIRHGGSREQARLAQEIGLAAAKAYDCKASELLDLDNIGL